ncbi:MAG: hypothetical protein LBP86_06215 [Azoarcus sp.]|nr:hypothetical protein [Azoarcus sp.]
MAATCIVVDCGRVFQCFGGIVRRRILNELRGDTLYGKWNFPRRHLAQRAESHIPDAIPFRRLACGFGAPNDTDSRQYWRIFFLRERRRHHQNRQQQSSMKHCFLRIHENSLNMDFRKSNATPVPICYKRDKLTAANKSVQITANTRVLMSSFQECAKSWNEWTFLSRDSPVMEGRFMITLDNPDCEYECRAPF